jgi:ABC-type transport system involved in cytochrome bd biosynthesis fused ATPase/permease subunit
MILKYLKLQGKTIIMPTHALKYAQYADQIVIMKKGRIIKKGSYE